MPDVKAFDLIANSVRAPESHIRRNVAAALGVLGDGRGIPLLTDLAVADPDDSVREAAEAELRLVDGPVMEELRRHLRLRMQSTDRRKALEAMALVGRLRQRGLDLRETGDSQWGALWRVITSDSKLSTFRQVVLEQADRYRRLRPTYKLRWRAWPVGLLGALLAAGLLACYVRATVGFGNDGLAAYLVCASLLGTLGIVFATRRSIPMLFQWDPSASLCRDVIETTIWSFFLVTVGCIPYLLGAGVAWDDAVGLAATAGALTALGFGAVHVGNYLALSTWRSRFSSWLWLVTIATGAGASVHTLVLWAVRLRVDNDHEAWLAEAVWLLALPASAAIAFSLGRIDVVLSTESFAERLKSLRTRGAVAIASTSALIVALAVLRLLSTTDGRTVVRSPPWDAAGGGAVQVRQPLRRPITTYRLDLPFAQQVAFDVPPHASLALAQSPGVPATDSGARGCPDVAFADAYTLEAPMSSTAMLLSAGCYLVQTEVRGLQINSFADVLLARSPYIQRDVRRDAELVTHLNVGAAEFRESLEKLEESHDTSWLMQGFGSRRIPVITSRSFTLRVDSGVVGQVHIPDTSRMAVRSSLKLTTAAGHLVAAGPILRSELKAGAYFLEVSPSSDNDIVWAYADFEGRITRSHSFSAVPAVFSFVQQSTGLVRASTTQDELDLVVEIWTATDWDRRLGRPIAERDDPPVVETVLGPGSYVAVVRAYDQGSRASSHIPVAEHQIHVLADHAGALTVAR